MSAVTRNKERSFGSVFLFQPGFLMALGWGLFTLSWILPNHYNPWLGFPSESMAFCAIAVLIVGVLAGPNIRWPTLALVVAVFAVIPWVQQALGINTFAGDALMASYFLIGWAAAIAIGYQLVKQRGAQSVLALMHMLWIAALLSAMLGLLQWLKLEHNFGIYVAQTDPGDPVMGNLAQPNLLGTLLLMGMVAYGYIFECRIIGKPTFALGIGFMTTILVATHSRAAMVGVLLIGGFLMLKRRRIASRVSILQIVVWMSLFALMTVISPSLEGLLLLNVESEPVFSASGRMLIWMQSWEGIRNSPWVGYGWNQTFSATAVGAAKHPGVLIATYAHNAFLDVLAWNGLPVGLALIGIGSYWFCTRLYRVTGLTGTYAMACLLPFAFQSMVELPFAYAFFLLAAGLLMGVVEADLISDPKDVSITRFWIGSAVSIWIVVGASIAIEYLLIEEDFRVTRFENLSVGVTDVAYRAPQIWLLTHMATLQRATRYRPVSDMKRNQLEDMRLAVLRFPGGGVALRYAMALAMNGDPEGARKTMGSLCGIYGQRFYVEAKKIWIEKSKQSSALDAVALQNLEGDISSCRPTPVFANESQI